MWFSKNDTLMSKFGLSKKKKSWNEKWIQINFQVESFGDILSIHDMGEANFK